ncbi:MAG: hypothetical protein JNJ60_14675 [Rhodocyclaceae bacterium]|nr:hypothetical protein [Rhodocyclaceae bacterium]
MAGKICFLSKSGDVAEMTHPAQVRRARRLARPAPCRMAGRQPPARQKLLQSRFTALPAHTDFYPSRGKLLPCFTYFFADEKTAAVRQAIMLATSFLQGGPGAGHGVPFAFCQT